MDTETYLWCKMAYDNGWTDATQLKIWVRPGKLTSEDYKKITDIDYTV